MNKFGYSLSPASVINLDKVDSSKFMLLAKLEPDVRKCMACGSCTATCTAGKFTKTSLRTAILALQNGLEEKAYESLKGCMMKPLGSYPEIRQIWVNHLYENWNNESAWENGKGYQPEA